MEYNVNTGIKKASNQNVASPDALRCLTVIKMPLDLINCTRTQQIGITCDL